MLPRLIFPKEKQPILDRFLRLLKQAGFSGEINSQASTRLINATDNSVYQILPEAVLTPRSTYDIIKIFQITNQIPFQSLTFTARGGGTGTNGQSLNDGIIIDCSKYLHHILELNLKEGWVRVEPGVVLDQLNRYLKPHGVFFAPMVSTGNRATLGGMVNTDACGKGSRVYGKTSQHVLAITAVYSDGTLHTSHAISRDELMQLKQQTTLLGAIYRQVDETVCQHHEKIVEQFPRLKRFMTGYDLAHVYDETQFNLNAILTGSEGTLAVVTELKLKLTSLPKYKILFILNYKNFHAALFDAQSLVAMNPHAIETMDETVLELAKTDWLYPKVASFLDQDCGAVNLIEFAGDDLAELKKKIEHAKKEKNNHAITHHVVTDSQDIANLWKLREKSVGLLGKMPGKRKPVSGIEDTVVPPEKLADYVTEFKALLDKAGLRYAMYGHIDVGCLHVRPALDMQDPNDEALYYELADQVAALTKKYGGLMWGEHGKGLRSQYVPMFFGSELYTELRKIKAAFDPYDQLNPGKIAVPIHRQETIIPMTAMKRATINKQINLDLTETYPSALNCNGNGACFNYDTLDVMCPSYKATRDRCHSPKGRASLTREWLYLQSASKKEMAFPRWVNTLRKQMGQSDFSHEVYDAMQGCLGCKACTTQCPVNVDIPTMKSAFLETYHARYLRPLRDHAIAQSERIAYRFSSRPVLANALMFNPLSRWLTKIFFNLQDLPKWVSPSLNDYCHQHHIPLLRVEELTLIKTEKTVVLIQDWLTSHYEPELVVDYILLLRKLGFAPVILHAVENGKGFHARGFLSEFQRVAERTAKTLTDVAALGLPMIGIDPSITLTYRQEYPAVLGEVNFRVHLIQEWLMDQTLPETIKSQDQVIYFFPHCTEKTADAFFVKQWQTIMAKCGVTLQINEVGCCGMAGSYGLEVEHQTTSRQIYNASWRDNLKLDTLAVATGFSCRSQVARYNNQKIMHPVSWWVRQD